MNTRRLFSVTLWVQSVYMLLTALWGLLHTDSFMKVTGPKTDIWLVKTVSVILVSIAVYFILEALKRNYSVNLAIFLLLNSTGLAAIDFYYSLTDRIRNIYMLDGILQIIFAAIWIYILGRTRRIKPVQ